MNHHQTSIDSDTGQMAVWPTKKIHEVRIEVDGKALLVLVDVVIADLPSPENRDIEIRFLLCGVHPYFDSPDTRITGIEVPFLELPQALRDEIVVELSRIAGI
jgi:hypothetical protein